MNIENELKVAMMQELEEALTGSTAEVLTELITREQAHGLRWVCLIAYNYGKMQGKREERSRRKAAGKESK